MTTANNFPIHVQSVMCVDGKPFEGDLIDRKKIADSLIKYINRLPHGGVIAINASWGEGKTWFGLNLRAELREQQHKTVYIDAFKLDYIDDPFVMICGELINELGAQAVEIKSGGAKVAKVLIPAATRIAINTFGRLVIGAGNLSDELKKSAEELYGEVASEVEKQLSKKLDEYIQDKKSVDAFRDNLAKAASSENKPIVVIVDELDRCRPDFAVKTIERIKHFFDVPKIVFILLINKKHLESAINGMYGPKVDAAGYLSKFIHLSLQLPKRIAKDNSDFNLIYSEEIAKRLGLQGIQSTKNFIEVFSKLAGIYDLSLRDLERGFSLFSLAQPENANFIPFLLAWVITIKLKAPDIFRGLLANRNDAHLEALEFSKPLDSIDVSSAVRWSKRIKCIQELHEKHQDLKQLSEDTNDILINANYSLSRERCIQNHCSLIDFNING